MTPRAEAVLFSDGTRAVLPLTRQRLARGVSYVDLSSPAGTYGGWLSADRLGAGHAELLVRHLLQKRRAVWWRVNPFDPLAASVAGLPLQADWTQALPLSSDTEGVCARAHHGPRSAARKAVREGVSVRLAQSDSDWHGYYRIYLQLLEHWGGRASSRYDWSLFDALGRLEGDQVRLWLADYGDRLIGGGICLYSHTHVSYWHAATLPKFRHLRPSDLLAFTMIEDACERGYGWFDFNPSGGHEGVVTFKKRFGCDSLAAPFISRQRPWASLLHWGGCRPTSIEER
jgi:hypothetical protein